MCTTADTLRNLRCIDWTTLEAHKDELFFSESSEAQSGLLNRLTGGQLFSLSRPTRPGERIDIFMSHSWHDSSKVKWEKLKGFAEEFKLANNRYPTLWLDNVCLDQCRINEGLKALPVNLMACRSMLVLSGKTYPRRLWCAWELLTLFAFTDTSHAIERVKLVPIDETDDGQYFDALAELERFDVLNAHCYDPNEEKRLREVIAAVGVDRFNERIRHLATVLRSEAESPPTRRLSLRAMTRGRSNVTPDSAGSAGSWCLGRQ